MHADLKQAVFAALADDTRRQIIELLVDEGAKTATQLSEIFPISRQGVTKHMNILVEAHLVTIHPRGRDKYYHLTPEPLEETSMWIAAIAARWDKRLAALSKLVEEEEDAS